MSDDSSPVGPAPFDPDDLARHGRFVRSLARDLARDEDEADELAARTLEAALVQRPSGGPGLRVWLRRVLKRLSLRNRRDTERRIARERMAARGERVPSTSDVVARLELERRIASAFSSLETADREVLFLRYFDDLPPRAIATRLQAPVETVRTRIKRGLERLRLALDRMHGDRREAWVATATALALGSGGSGIALKCAAAAAVVLGLIGVWRAVGPGSNARPPSPPIAASRAGAAEAAAPADATRETALSVNPTRTADAPAAFASGVVVDSDGAPVPGVAIVAGELCRRDPDDLYVFRMRLDRIGASALTRTDARGRFTVQEPTADLAELQFVKAGFAITRWREIDRDRARNGDLRIVLPRARRITGRIHDREGRPITSAAIVAFKPWARDEKSMRRKASHLVDAPEYFSNEHWPELATRPEADGAFELSVLPDAKFALTINSWGYEMFSAGADCDAADPMDITLRRHALLIDVVDAESGKAVERPRVVAGLGHAGEVFAQGIPARERFVFDEIDLCTPPNRIDFEVESLREWFEGDAAESHPVRLTVFAPGFATRTVDVELRLGEELPHVEVALTPATDAPSFSGHVQAPSRARLDLRLRKTRREPPFFTGEVPLATTTCDRDGAFAFRGLPAADYRLDVIAPECGRRWLDVTLPAAGFEIELDPEAVLDVLALDDATHGIAGVPVVAQTTDGSCFTWLRITEADGHARFDGLPKGDLVVGAFGHYVTEAFSRGMQALDARSFLPGADVHVAAGEHATFAIPVPRARPVSIRVLDDLGAPIPGAVVRIDGSLQGSAHFQDDRFHDRLKAFRENGVVAEVDGVAHLELFPSRYGARVAAGGRVVQFEFEVAVAGTSEFDVRVGIHGLGATIRGQVRELGTDAPLASCKVYWVHRADASSGRMEDFAFTDSDGRYELKGVPLGDTAACAYGPDSESRGPLRYQSTSREFVVRDRGPLEFDFVLARLLDQDATTAPCSAEFTVLDDANGTPLEGADVDVSARIDGSIAWLGGGETSSAGKLTLRLASAASFRVTATSPWVPARANAPRTREVRELPAPVDGVLRATFRLKRD